MKVEGIEFKKVKKLVRGVEWKDLGIGKYMIMVKEYDNENWNEVENMDLVEIFNVGEKGIELDKKGIRWCYDEGMDEGEEYSDYDVLDMWSDNLFEGDYEIMLYEAV